MISRTLSCSQIVLLGQNGLIGAHLHQRLLRLENPPPIIGLSSAELDLTLDGAGSKLCSILDSGTVLIYCAARMKGSINPDEIFSQNMAMTRNVILAIQEKPPSYVVHLGSTGIYGEDVFHSQPLDESTLPRPTSFYAISKYASERILDTTLAQLRVPFLAIRTSCIYGPGDRLAYTPSGFLKAFLLRQPLTIWGDGTELRDFLYVDDLCMAILRLIEKRHCGILNVVNGSPRSFADCIAIATTIAGYEVPITRHERTKEKVDAVFNPAYLRLILPEFNPISLEQGMENTWKILRDSQ